MIPQIPKAFDFKNIYFYAQAIIKYSTEFRETVASVGTLQEIIHLSHLEVVWRESLRIHAPSAVSKVTVSIQRQLRSLE